MWLHHIRRPVLHADKGEAGAALDRFPFLVMYPDGQDPENGGRHKFCSERASASLRSSLVSGQTVLVSDKALHSIQIVSVSYSDMYYKLYSANTGCFYSVIRNSAVLNHYTNEIRCFKYDFTEIIILKRSV